MKTSLDTTLAWLLPVSLFIHQLEEFVLDFPLWFSTLLRAQLSDSDFLIINGGSLALLTFFAATFNHLRNKLLLLALGTLVFVNAMIHLLIGLLTWSYSPGTFSGSFLLIPLAFVIYRRTSPWLTANQRITAICLGILLLLAVGSIAMSI